MYDVIAVNITTRKVRMLGENKTERNADAIEMLAVARLGCDEEFFTRAPAGKYKDGDKFEADAELAHELCDGTRGALCIHQDPNMCNRERDCPAFERRRLLPRSWPRQEQR